MPGFKIGGSGDPAVSTIESHRKHRWLFSVISGGSDVTKKESVYLSSAQRPHAIIDEAIMHHDQEQVYFAGKHHWDPITLVFYDVYGEGETSSAIWKWLNKGVDIKNATAGLAADYKKDSTLELNDAKGTANETWKIYNSWAIDVNYNDLDYSNSEIATIDVSMKYDRAVRE
jgi:hypothetical protein